MATIVVTFSVADEHIGTDEGEYARRLDGELMRLQHNSEVGLRVLDATINGAHIYSRSELAKMNR